MVYKAISIYFLFCVLISSVNSQNSRNTPTTSAPDSRFAPEPGVGTPVPGNPPTSPVIIFYIHSKYQCTYHEYIVSWRRFVCFNWVKVA
uniref:Uncharacterized protein n=1 Tax=Lepeophtheirus salmonis TaxID=72036 RepID=A0A0K2TBX6_LEPSM